MYTVLRSVVVFFQIFYMSLVIYTPATAMEAGEKKNDTCAYLCSIYGVFTNRCTISELLIPKTLNNCFFVATGFPLWWSILGCGLVATVYTTLVSYELNGYILLQCAHLCTHCIIIISAKLFLSF